MIKIGDPVRFIPSVCYGLQQPNKAVTGRIIYINHAHRWFTLEYEARGTKLRESYKFFEDMERDFTKQRLISIPRQFQSKHDFAIF